MVDPGETVSFGVVVREGGLYSLSGTLKRMFEHPWVASYMIGFGPPLIRSSDRITARVKIARSALEKLEAYVEVCLLDEEERKRLTALHRKLMTRSRGPLEAEQLDEASAEVIDLSIRLHHPALAPPQVSQAMRMRGINFDVVPMKSPPDALSARIMVRLADPRGTRMIDTAQVRDLIDEPAKALAIELRVPPNVRGFYATWLDQLGEGLAFVHFSDPVARARVTRDGEKA
jgi:hypothetical protein